MFHLEWTTDGSWSTNYDPPKFDKPTYRINVGSKVAGQGVDESGTHFDYDIFFASLDEFRTLESRRAVSTWKQALRNYDPWFPKLSWGNHLMYGETITSTNTLLSR